MLLWALVVAGALTGVRFLFGGWREALPGGVRELKASARVASALFRELQELIEVGVPPGPGHWREVESLPAPWGTLAGAALERLRGRGAPVSPTLSRLREAADATVGSLDEAAARSYQAVVQALFCTSLIPVFGAFLYVMLPGLEGRAASWSIVCSAALLLSLTGALWIMELASRAARGGLSADRAQWPLFARAAGEFLLASIRAGDPGDVAWVSMSEFLRGCDAELAARWGATVWESDSAAGSGCRGPLEKKVASAGEALRRSVEAGLMEGRGCAERLEGAIRSLEQEQRVAVERETSVLPARVLKPLFACVAPSLVGLIVTAGWFTWRELAL